MVGYWVVKDAEGLFFRDEAKGCELKTTDARRNTQKWNFFFRSDVRIRVTASITKLKKRLQRGADSPKNRISL